MGFKSAVVFANSRLKPEAVGGRTHLLSGDDVQVRVGAVESEVRVNGDSTADVDSLVLGGVGLALDSNLQKYRTYSSCKQKYTNMKKKHRRHN